VLEDSDIEEGVMPPRALSGAAALAIPEADAESATEIIVIYAYEKEETIVKLAKIGTTELKRTVVISKAGVTTFSRQILITKTIHERWMSKSSMRTASS